MEKTMKNKMKDYRRLKGKKWLYEPTWYDKRTCASGVTFWGKYVYKK